jgi:hypothetical protein
MALYMKVIINVLSEMVCLDMKVKETVYTEHPQKNCLQALFSFVNPPNLWLYALHITRSWLSELMMLVCPKLNLLEITVEVTIRSRHRYWYKGSQRITKHINCRGFRSINISKAQSTAGVTGFRMREMRLLLGKSKGKETASIAVFLPFWALRSVAS